MRKCHYIYDEAIGKVLIPLCWNVVHSYNMRDCTCRQEPKSVEGFAHQRYNEVIAQKNNYIKELEKENARLIRILRKAKGFK